MSASLLNCPACQQLKPRLGQRMKFVNGRRRWTCAECAGPDADLAPIVHRAWQPHEDALLIKFYPERGSRCLSMFPGRTLASMKSRVRVLGKTRGLKRDFDQSPRFRTLKAEMPERDQPIKPRKVREEPLAPPNNRPRDGIPMVVSVWQYAERVAA
jgi:hypothetical protein